jgi:hypothetical protein
VLVYAVGSCLGQLHFLFPREGDWRTLSLYEARSSVAHARKVMFPRPAKTSINFLPAGGTKLRMVGASRPLLPG